VVAFVGRSNVGKSSLLNRLVRQRKLARVSKRPGRTQEINFFLIDERFVIADLPGYGFARVPQALKADWKPLVEAFLSGRSDLRVVFVLVDCRRGMQREDEQLVEYLQALRRQVVIALTKVDKISRAPRNELLRALAARRPCLPVVASSAETGEGVDVLWEYIREAC
jgi:GTP-binding protein